MKIKRNPALENYPPATNAIIAFLHCKMCLDCLPEGESPASWARQSTGRTAEGIQVRCWRHNCNIAHFSFKGMTGQMKITDTTDRTDATNMIEIERQLPVKTPWYKFNAVFTWDVRSYILGVAVIELVRAWN